jgi:hypothetical protein
LKSAVNSSTGGRGAPGLKLKGPVWPAGMTTIIGFALPAAIRLSRMNPARPTVHQESSQSIAPCNR